MKKHYLTFTLMFLTMFSTNLLLAQNIHTVTIDDSQFQPANLTIDEGDIVHWVNQGSMIHTSTSGISCTPDGEWGTGNLNPGQGFFVTFNNSGNFPYFCFPHCSFMTGNISVTPGTGIYEVSPSDQMELKFAGPNPFINETALLLKLRTSADVKIGLYDLLGNQVKEIHSGDMQPGETTLKLSGTGLNTGVYFLRLTSGGSIITYKAIKL